VPATIPFLQKEPMTFQLTPQRPGVIDMATGKPMHSAGVTRDVVLPPDHVQERTGDITIIQVAVEAKPDPAPARA